MNKKQLDLLLTENTMFQEANEEDVIKHFDEKFDKVQYKDDYLYIFNQDREFYGKDHIITLHHRKSSLIPMHIFNYIVLTYVYEGSLTINIDGKIIVLNTGDLIIFDRHVPHSVEKTKSNDLGINIVLGDNFFSKQFLNHLPKDNYTSKFMRELMTDIKSHTHYLTFKTEDDELIRDCIDKILCEQFDSSLCSDEMIDYYIIILITQLFRKFQYNTNLTNVNLRNEKLMSEISNYIRTNYIEGSLKIMCKDLGYDSSYTSRVIKDHFGKTFKKLVNDERMKKASILLHNKSLPIYEIAQTVGITNLTSFYSRFKEYSGCTPMEYREKFE